MMRRKPVTSQAATTDTSSLAVVVAADILRDNIETPPRLMELARLVGLSHPRLNRMFRHHFGTTAFGYLRILRLEEARRLLEKSDINVTDAAFSVGYQSLPSFSRAFRDRFGLCPRQYRNSLRQHGTRSETTAPDRREFE